MSGLRIVLLVLDGLADRAWPALDGRTPLEAAETPALDRLAAAGTTGLLHPLGRGVAPGSDMAHWALFGYPPALFPGRGVFETLGEDLPLAPGDVAMRALFASAEEQPDGTLLVTKRRADVPDDVLRELASSLPRVEAGALTAELVFTSAGQGIVYVRGGGSPDVTDSDPFEDGALALEPQALETAENADRAEATAALLGAFMRATREALLEAGTPANLLLTKWASRDRDDIPAFEDAWGMRAAMVAWGFLFRGLGRRLGMSWYPVRYAEDPADDLETRLREARRAFADGHEFVHVHTKAPDVAGHTKDPTHKRDVLAALDEGLGRMADELLDGETLLVVTGDHATPSGTTLIHSAEAVPLLIAGPSVTPDAVAAFGERACMAGGLGHVEGRELMPTLLNLADRVRYSSARPTPRDLPYRASGKPFTMR